MHNILIEKIKFSQNDWQNNVTNTSVVDGVNMAMVSQLYQEKTNTNETKGN